jgi:hypothetical protein
MFLEHTTALIDSLEIGALEVPEHDHRALVGNAAQPPPAARRAPFRLGVA